MCLRVEVPKEQRQGRRDTHAMRSVNLRLIGRGRVGGLVFISQVSSFFMGAWKARSGRNNTSTGIPVTFSREGAALLQVWQAGRPPECLLSHRRT
jgi:hypothetical protein